MPIARSVVDINYNSSFNPDFCLCRPTVTLHQGQGHQNEHDHSRYMPCISLLSCQVWMPLSINTVQDIAILLQVKICQVWDAVMTFNEEQGHQTDNLL